MSTASIPRLSTVPNRKIPPDYIEKCARELWSTTNEFYERHEEHNLPHRRHLHYSRVVVEETASLPWQHLEGQVIDPRGLLGMIDTTRLLRKRMALPEGHTCENITYGRQAIYIFASTISLSNDRTQEAEIAGARFIGDDIDELMTAYRFALL